MSETPTFVEKLASLSSALRAQIITSERKYEPDPLTPVSNFLVHNKRHCNGGKTIDAGLWLRQHCDDGGKIFLTMSGAGSSFQMGIMISEMIRAGLITGISVTGANLEESLYRLLAHSNYAYIPDYTELTRAQEKELDDAGLRRITDTFLPEDESVRVILPLLEAEWRAAQKKGESLLWHEFFFRVLKRRDVVNDPGANPDDCWLLTAMRNNVEVFVPGWEDSTMGNIFTYYCYRGDHPFLKQYRQDEPISMGVVQHGAGYMHRLAELYMDNAEQTPLAFLQLGGGIAADFPICVVPHLKKDYLFEESLGEQERLIQPWAGFVEIHSSPMSFGSYSGAGFKEKITWGKFAENAFGVQIFGDFTEHFPDIAALVLRK